MKFHNVTTLAKALPALALAIATSNMAVGQDNNDTPAEQRDRPTTTAPDDTSVVTSEETPLSDTDCIDIPEGASANARVTGAGNAQGKNSQDNSNTPESGADANQSAGEAANSTVQIAQNRDDCIDIRTERQETQD